MSGSAIPSLTDRYTAAEQLLPHNMKHLVVGGRVQPLWVAGTDDLVYSDGRQFLYVDGSTGHVRPAFDHHLLAAHLSSLTGTEAAEDCQALVGLTMHSDWFRFVFAGSLFDVPRSSGIPSRIGAAPAMHESRSPDGRWVVTCRDHDLWVRDSTDGSERRLTTDGKADHDYATNPDVSRYTSLLASLGGTSLPPLIMWSPDSSRFVTHRLDQRSLRSMPLTQAAPRDGSRPTASSYRCALVGDAHVATGRLLVLDVESGARVDADNEPLLVPYMSPIPLKQVWWSGDGSTVFFISFDRGDSRAALKQLDPATGKVLDLAVECSETHVQLAPLFTDNNWRVLATGEVLLWSERSGWGHLYLQRPEGPARELTQGSWLVREVVAVDEARRLVWFTAAGRESGLDPYLRQLYTVSLNTGEITRLSKDELDHLVTAGPNGHVALDVASRWDTPATSTLWNLSKGTSTLLCRADATRLLDIPHTIPERVEVLADDGVTRLYGFLYKPAHFDPESRYPVLDDIYPGPQINAALPRFPASGGLTSATGALAAAALGFVVLVLDARGTPLRSKSFQDATYGASELTYLDDHASAIRQLATTRPWMDLDRVGIYGHSGGGYAAARALLTHGDLFRVGVSSAGAHDDLHYHAYWGEKFVGPPQSTDYAARSNPAKAAQLSGKLLLMHGELDDNVTPHLSLKLVDALIAHDKDFDMLIVPNAEHGFVVRSSYVTRRRWDYLVRHLLGVEPPTYQLAPFPVDLESLAAALG